MILESNWALFGPGGLPKGPWVDSASFGPTFNPNWPILAPIRSIFVFHFLEIPYWIQIAPSPALVQGPYGWALGPMEAEGQLFRAVWGLGRRSWPATRGDGGEAAAPPTETGHLELFAIAKSGTLISAGVQN